MGDKIKSAWEKAMERLEEKSTQASKEDVMEMELRPEGQKIAGRFLKEDDFKISDTLEQYSEKQRKVIKKIVEEILVSRLVLPENEDAQQENRRVMEGILDIKKNKNFMRPVLEELEFLFKQYIQAREQSYESLKQDFKSRFSDAVQQMQGQISSEVDVDPEQHPRFREEWIKLVGKVNEKFLPVLESAREKIREVE